MSRDPEIAFLQRLALTAASAPSMGELVRLVISETTEALGTDVCSVYLVDPADGHLVLTATNGLSQEGVNRVRLAPGEGVTGWAAAERAPAVVPDVRSEPRFRWLDGVDQARFVSMCSVPILAGGTLVGVLNVQTDELREFTPEDVRFLSAIAAQVAGVIARADLQERLEREVAELGRSEEARRLLSELVLDGAGLTAVCEEISRLAGAPVWVLDPEGEPLVGEAVPPRDARTEAIPLRAGHETVGHLVVGAAPGPRGAGARQALEHGATVLSLEIVRERAASDAEERISGDLLGGLISTRMEPDEAERTAERAARMGHRLRGPAWVLVVAGDDARAGHALAGRGVRQRLARAIEQIATDADATAVVVARPDGAALLVGGLGDAPAAEAFTERLRDAAGALVPGLGVSCGLSGAAGPPAELYRLAEQARGALRVSHRLGRRGAVASYRLLGIERVLLAVDRRETLDRFADDWIGPLVRHDENGRGGAAPLLETLDGLIAEGWNMRAAARRLGVHVNTLLYRVGRIEALLGRRLDDPDARLALALAVRARAVVAGAPSTGVAVIAGEPPARPTKEA